MQKICMIVVVEETRAMYQIEFMRCGVHCLGREILSNWAVKKAVHVKSVWTLLALCGDPKCSRLMLKSNQRSRCFGQNRPLSCQVCPKRFCGAKFSATSFAKM